MGLNKNKMDVQQRRLELKQLIENLGTTDPRVLDYNKLAEKYDVKPIIISGDINFIKKENNIFESETGITGRKNITVDDEDVEIIFIKYEENDRIKGGVATFFPNRQIATISKVFEDSETGEIEDTIVKKGMTKKEIERFFPPKSVEKSKGYAYNMTGLIRSIIYEAYRKEGLTKTIDGGTVRHFWYTHLKSVLVGVLGLTENDSIIGAMNSAWSSVINSGIATYEGMSIVGGKEAGRISIVKDSPFSNLIIAVEKQNFFETFKWIPRLFNCTLITAGGAPSRAVTRRFIYELKNLGVNLDQQFHMCVASDLDPAGYMIQGAFKGQLESAIKYYGGSGKVKVHRLFVRKDQVSSSLLESQAIPWQETIRGERTQKKIDTVKKTSDTRWKKFCEETRTDDDPEGGLYIPVPDGWTGDVFEINGKPMVRALLEMDAFSTEVIEKSLVKDLLRIIRETSDETKIMIPEIMRVFEEMRDAVASDLYERWKEILIDPLKEEFLKDTDEWEEFIEDEKESAEAEIDERYEELKKEKEKEKYERVPELFDEKHELEQQKGRLEELLDEEIRKLREEYSKPISNLWHKCNVVGYKISEKCSDINEEIEKLNDEKIEEEGTLEEQCDFRMERYNKFKEGKVAVFNPVEQALKSDIENILSQANLPYFFPDLENRDKTREYISYMLTNTKLLLEENISCFDHPAPTFKGENYLEQASQNKDLNIEKVRDAFSDGFLKAMKENIETDTQDLTFELSKTVEMKDLSQEVKDAMEETERELDKVGESNE